MNAVSHDAHLRQLLELVETNPGISSARACKRLGLSRSELQRLLLVLGDDVAMGGLGLLRIVSEPPPARLWLNASAPPPDASA